MQQFILFLRRRLPVMVLTMFVLAGCNSDDLPIEFDAPDSIAFVREGLYPEGIGYDRLKHCFLVSSLRFGTVGLVSEKGDYIPFIKDNALISTIGLRVDQNRNRVLVAVSDPGAGVRTSAKTAGKLAALGIYNLLTGERIAFVDLGSLRPDAGHFANDIALDDKGNSYVTDSFAPIIYKVDKAGNASVFFENDALSAPQGEFGLNGIVYHPDGFLIVAKADEGALLKIPVGNPASFSQIDVPVEIPAPDGLLLRKDGKLVVVGNAGGIAPGKVFLFETSNKWTTATISGEFTTPPVFPTTLTERGNDQYVLFAYLNRLFEGTTPPVSEFSINKVIFKESDEIAKK